jgi:hypothetical protein
MDNFSGGTTGTTAGTTSSGCTYTTTDPAAIPPNPPPYSGADGMKYVPLSRVPGAQCNAGPAVLPTIYGAGCPGGVGAALPVGAAAPTVFTGLFVNGVMGAINPSISGMAFTNAATAIEASLGDLESVTNAQQAGIDTSALGVTPQAGWYAFYYAAAKAFLQPMMVNLNALIAFVNEMAIISDIHYGFIAFNDSIGTDANSMSGPINNLSSSYNHTTPNAYGNSINSSYPLPNIALSKTDSKQSAIINVLPALSVWGGRNVSQALQAAADQLTTNGRVGANKAIVLITSGIPNGDDSPSAAIAKATTVGQSGIPVYVICTSIASTYHSGNDEAYTDIGGSAGGVAGVSGHGAKYYRIDYNNPTATQNQLTSVFANIARRLVSIVQN